MENPHEFLLAYKRMADALEAIANQLVRSNDNMDALLRHDARLPIDATGIVRTS